jgi:hypothetical protein
MSFGINIVEVSIYRLEEGVFYSKLLCNNGGKNIEIDARTSDAIALALRFKCPMYTTEEIMQKSGIIIDIQEKGDKKFPKAETKDVENEKVQPSADYSKYKKLDIKTLEDLLAEAVKNEEYEKASMIRDEIEKRKK